MDGVTLNCIDQLRNSTKHVVIIIVRTCNRLRTDNMMSSHFVSKIIYCLNIILLNCEASMDLGSIIFHIFLILDIMFLCLQSYLVINHILYSEYCRILIIISVNL